MQRIIWQHGVRVDIVADHEIWGRVTNRWSKKSSQFERDQILKASGKLKPTRGQLAKREWDCRFCKKECGTLGDFKDHLYMTHWNDNKYARHIPKNSTEY